MGKGELTRQAILERAVGLASQVGFDGLTIGGLADDLELSKSGLFAHFRSKEALQVQALELASERFRDVVVKPALTAPRGEPRVRALFTRWLDWPKAFPQARGCVFVAASAELDDRPGPARELVVRLQKEWLGVLARAARIAVEEGHFRRALDPEQFAFELKAVMLAYHLSTRLLRDPRAEEKTRRAFEGLLRAARPPE
jgi:AcrR family transcriptional regulator